MAGEALQGLLLVDKPEGFTSFDVVALLRGILHTKKIGHTGTLDPMATGVLPVLVGRATKLCELLPESEKSYTVTFALGYTTDTLDRTGEVLTRREVTAGERELRALLPSFLGTQQQIPPMYSAIRQNGVRLYDLARNGQTVDRQPREITIHELSLLSCNEEAGEYTLSVRCSKGTYIRSLCADLGERLGCGATVTALRRTMANGFGIERCHTLEELKTLGSAALLPTEAALTSYDAVRVTAAQAKRFSNGGALALDRIPFPAQPTRFLRVCAPDGTTLGLGRPEDGELKLQCLLI